MFIPIFIAILMGLISPASHNSNGANGGTVYVTNSGSDEGNPDTDPGDGGDGGDDTGIGGPGPANPGGGSGQNPPPRP